MMLVRITCSGIQLTPPVAKRARDYDAMFTYQHIVSMCKQEGLRWQAAGLSARVVNIRKDILCYRLALKEVRMAATCSSH